MSFSFILSLLIVTQASLAAAYPHWRFPPWLGQTPGCQHHRPWFLCSDVQTSSPILGRDSTLSPSSTSPNFLGGQSSLATSTGTASSTFSTPLVDGTTVTTFLGPSIQTVTITSLPSQQTPTATSALSNSPDTIGSVNPSIETSGHPGSFPFPTSLPTVSQSTLQPTNITAPFPNATVTSTEMTVTNTLTLPLTTFETVFTTITVTSIPTPTSATITQVTVINSTFTSNGSAVVTSSVGTTVITTNATGLVGVTFTQLSTVTGTLSTTVTAGASFTGLPQPQSSCILSSCSGQDIFQPVDLTPPVAQVPLKGGHPVPRLGIVNATSPIQTNKFFSNIYLGSQGSPVFTMPYSLAWAKGSGNAQSWGMAVSHLEDSQKVFGPPNTNIPGSPSSYYINPLGIQSLILSASELGTGTVLTSDSIAQFSANIKLQPVAGSGSSITFPVVQGMGFVTGLYNNLQPAIQSSVFFRSVTVIQSPATNVFKYRVVLEDDRTWLIYATSSSGLTPNLKLVSSTLLQGIVNWSGTIQVAKVPYADAETLYDAACGVYAVSGAVAGYANDASAQYSISWTKNGMYADEASLLMFALPHHIQSFAEDTNSRVTNLTLATTVKGIATAVVANYWVMTENALPVSMGFAPWRPGQAEAVSLSTAAISTIQNIASIEASQDMGQQTNLNSMYYSGKALSKFASIIYVMNDLADQKQLAAAALAQLKTAFAVFSSNQQQFPLYYDTDWKGVVSSASYVTGDSGVDFGNSYYNDHHFHYGYFIHAAAIIGYLDPSWLLSNKDYVNALVRDVSNPSTTDIYFPVFRSFDWYHGHSWAKGLFESGDGKDQESSSEDAMFAYALKMWGRTTGDKSMEARGNLMLALQARTFGNYFLLKSSNKVQPSNFIGNKVTGILFENKVDHTTYFGSNLEYIQGIHMLPLEPFSTLTRDQSFVTEEWDTYFSDGAVDQALTVQGGWKGILYANLAMINPQAAYNFFTQPNFDPSWLDGGASRTWYIAYAAGLGGSTGAPSSVNSTKIRRDFYKRSRGRVKKRAYSEHGKNSK